METQYVWLFMFAGATMMVVGICLLASEHELRKQRRELEELRRNRRISEAQASETELMTRNQELAEQISSLSGQLEESKRIVEELQSEQRQLVNAAELKPQLQASQETIKELEAEQQRLGSKGEIQMPQPVCPKCSSDCVKRVSRIGAERLISLFYIYPLGANRAGTDSDFCNGVSHIRRRNGLIIGRAEASKAYGTDRCSQYPQYDDCSEPLAVSSFDHKRSRHRIANSPYKMTLHEKSAGSIY